MLSKVERQLPISLRALSNARNPNVLTWAFCLLARPALSMNLDLRPAHMDLAMDIPAQPGLSFDVHLNLQNLDELHLSFSALVIRVVSLHEPEEGREVRRSGLGTSIRKISCSRTLAREAPGQSTATTSHPWPLGERRYMG